VSGRPTVPVRRPGLLRAAWGCRWSVLRLALAGFILWTLAADGAGRLARLQLAALPGFDYVQEVRALRAQGRFGEALVVADAGLSDPAASTEELRREREATAEEGAGVLRRLRAAGMGALSGRGDSLEALLGAIVADLFVVGDVRDLVIEGGKQLLDGDSDELVLLLSVVGLVTTLAPEVDWAPSVLKAARRAGMVSRPMADFLRAAIKGRRVEELEPVFANVVRLGAKASPGGAVRLIRHADTPEDLAGLAGFVERRADGAFALHVTGAEGARVLRGAGSAADDVIALAARKGRPGARFLASPAGRVLLRPHPLVGLAKGVWKGNIQKALARLAERMDPRAWWIIPVIAGWTVLETGLLGRRWNRLRRGAGRGMPAAS